jgi:cell division protein FtsI/penicillin-binding protein 2
MLNETTLSKIVWASLLLGVFGCSSEPTPRRAASPTPVAGGPSARPSTSTIDAGWQAIADEEVTRAVDAWRAEAGVVLVLEAATGAVLANAGRENGAPADVGTKRAFITGSTLKSVTLAAALEEGVVARSDRFDCERGSFSYQGKIMHDPGPNGVLTVPEMLATSTNVGFTKVFDRLGGAKLVHWLRAFHFGAPLPIEGAAAGVLPSIPDGKSYEGAVLAIGEAMATSPLQLAAAYATFANDGAYVAPALTRGPAAPREQIIKPETARTMMGLLDEAVNGELATGKLARFPGTHVVGKNGPPSSCRPGSTDLVQV